MKLYTTFGRRGRLIRGCCFHIFTWPRRFDFAVTWARQTPPCGRRSRSSQRSPCHPAFYGEKVPNLWLCWRQRFVLACVRRAYRLYGDPDERPVDPNRPPQMQCGSAFADGISRVGGSPSLRDGITARLTVRRFERCFARPLLRVRPGQRVFAELRPWCSRAADWRRRNRS